MNNFGFVMFESMVQTSYRLCRLANQSAEQLKEKELQLEVTNDAMTIYYPAGSPLKQFAKQDETYPFDQVQLALKDVKNLLLEKGVDKKDITLLIAEDVEYQTLITTMETVRSYQAVVVASVVDAELFPDIALDDALVEAL